MFWRFFSILALVALAPFLLGIEARRHGGARVGLVWRDWWRFKWARINPLMVPQTDPINTQSPPTPPTQSPAATTLWLHAVSLGEMRAAQLLLAQCQQEHPHLFADMQVVITYHTATAHHAAQEIIRGWPPTHRVPIVLPQPLDLPWVVARFIQQINPTWAMFMESEWWPHTSRALTRRRINALLVNARVSPKSFARYQCFFRLGGRALFAPPTAIFAQDETMIQRWQTLFPESVVHWGGQIKFAIKLSPAQIQRGLMFRKKYSPNINAPILMLASTRAGEEKIGIAIWRTINQAWRASGKSCRLLIVPRHPERFDEVARLLDNAQINYVRQSQADETLPAVLPAVILGDTMGELIAYYHAANAVVLGGSLLAYGGQNPLEAFAVGVPLCFGPHTYNIASIREDAMAQGAAVGVALGVTETNSEEALISDLAQAILPYLDNEHAAQKMVAAQQSFMDKGRQGLRDATRTLCGYASPTGDPTH